MSTPTVEWLTTAQAAALTGWLDNDRLPARLTQAGIGRNADGLWRRLDIARRRNRTRRAFTRRHRGIADAPAPAPAPAPPAPVLQLLDESRSAVLHGAGVPLAIYRLDEPGLPAWKVVVDNGTDPDVANPVGYGRTPQDAAAAALGDRFHQQ